MSRSPNFLLEPWHDGLEAQWRALDRIGAHSFFVSWTWIGALLRTANVRPLVVRVMRGSDLAGLALMTLRQARIWKVLPIKQAWLNATGDTCVDGVMIEHNGFALPSGHRADFWPDFVQWFKQEDFADELVAPGIADEDVHSRTRLLLVEKRSDGYRTPLRALGPEGIASAISSNARQQLRRSVRDYGQSLALDRAPDLATALRYFDALKELHIRSWTRRERQHAFDNPFFETFHRALIASGMEDDTVDLLRVRAGGNAVGYLYNFRRKGVVSSYQSGFDDAKPGLRPGYVCHALAMAYYAQRGEQVYDFLAGTNRLKQSFGIERYTLAWRHYRKPTFGFRAEHAARNAMHAVHRVLKGRQG